MKKTFTVLFLGAGLFSVLFPSCSTTRIASTSPAGNSPLTHGSHRTAAVEDTNDSSDSPDTFGNPLVEF
jgi:hypothetical protein